MLKSAITKIENERKEFKVGSLEFGISEVLLDVIKNNSTAAETVANTDKTIKDCSKNLWEIAKNAKEGNSYCMTPRDAEIHIKSFYEITEPEKAVINQGAKPIDILNYL